MGVNTTNASPHVGAGSSAWALSMVRVAAQVVAAHPDVDAAEHGKIMGQVRAVAECAPSYTVHAAHQMAWPLLPVLMPFRVVTLELCDTRAWCRL